MRLEFISHVEICSHHQNAFSGYKEYTISKRALCTLNLEPRGTGYHKEEWDEDD